jgi:AmiR/NasT family two-component response regulator
MVIEIKKPITKKKLQAALARASCLRKKKKSLRGHFGKLKRQLDRLAYQQAARHIHVSLG